MKADSETCYLFVKVEESPDFDTYMTYDMAAGWRPLDGTDGVYYRVVETDSQKDQVFSVLENDKVTVSEEVTEEKMAQAGKPTLTFTAYAVQYYRGENADGEIPFAPEDAWALAPTTAP